MWQLRIKIKSISKVHPCTFESYFGVQPETTHNSVFAVRSAHSNAFGTSQTRGTIYRNLLRSFLYISAAGFALEQVISVTAKKQAYPNGTCPLSQILR
jgi:hypothetical protein